MSLLLARVAPRDHEDLMPLGEVVLGDAPTGRDVEDVVLVDRRRDEEQRDFANLLGRRPVLEQLEHFVAHDHRPRRDRQVPADLELALINRRRQTGRGSEITCQSPRAADEIASARVDRLLDDLGVRPWEICRRDRVEHVSGRQPRAAFCSPIDLRVGDQAVHGLAEGEVALEQTAKQPVALPRRIAEAPVAFRRGELRPSRGHEPELGREGARARRHLSRVARQSGPDLDRRSGRHEPRSASGRRLGQHHVQTGPRRLAGTPNA